MASRDLPQAPARRAMDARGPIRRHERGAGSGNALRSGRS